MILEQSNWEHDTLMFVINEKPSKKSLETILLNISPPLSILLVALHIIIIGQNQLL